MPLEAGKRFGAFDVLGPLGAGGMGEVWRARDPRLNREVALKVLPEDFARDPERLVRFEREARVLAGLSHPGIGAIHGFEQSEGLRFLVLELVGGETLADRLGRGALPPEVAMRLGAQIAEALEAAHAKGVIHRDLKPANVKITPAGRAKVLDFGLAKEFGLPAGRGGADDSPTVTRSPSAAGLVVGTAPYMSPEQARGLEVDRRTDLWSLGCVLYEMLAGRRAFAGATTSDILAAVLTHEPEWAGLPPGTPPRLRSLLRRCLQKDPERRWHDAADVRLELEEMVAEGSDAGRLPAALGARSGSRFSRLLGWGALFLGGLAIGLLARSGGTPATPGRALRSFEIALPSSGALVDASYEDRGLALSPDGRYLAVTVVDANQSIGVHVRDLGSPTVPTVLQVDDGWDPFFSPDGEWLGAYLHVERSLRKFPLKGGGTPQSLCKVNDLRGGAWTADGSIVFADLTWSGLSIVASDGGERRPLTEVEEGGRVLAHRWPSPLPGGRHVLFGVVARSGRGEDNQVAAVELATGKVKILVEGASQPRYSQGRLLYVRNGMLMGAPFDPDRLELHGPASRLLAAEVFSVPKVGTAYYDLAGDLLVYSPRIDEATERQLVEVDRQGKTRLVTPTRRAYSSAAYSPDGRRLAVVMQSGPDTDLWVVDRDSDSWSRLIEGGDILGALWHPDGRRILVRSRNRQPAELLLVPADGSARPTRLFEHPALRGPGSFSPDGRWLTVTLDNPVTQADLFVLDLENGGALRPFLETPAFEGGGLFSPDGRWLAYRTRTAGKDELFVRSFPGPGVARAIASTFDAAWPPRSRELFIWQGGTILAAPFDAATGVMKDSFRRAFDVRAGTSLGALPNLSPDGQRLVYVPDEPSQNRLRLVAIAGFRPDGAPSPGPPR